MTNRPILPPPFDTAEVPPKVLSDLADLISDAIEDRLLGLVDDIVAQHQVIDNPDDIAEVSNALYDRLLTQVLEFLAP